MYLYLYMIMFIMIIVMMLISVAFFTLFERKFLGFMHLRKGPNKASFLGLTQPISDAVKLLSKEMLYSPKMNYKIYSLSPLMMMMIAIMLWSVFPTNFMSWTMKQSILFMLCCFSLSVYPVMLGGWASNSMYALIGSMRGMSQTISYEVSLSIILISCLILMESMNMYYLTDYIITTQLGNYLYVLWLLLYVTSLAEVNRTPFDFVEGESELVSGFNVEYFGCNFALIFLAEYSMIIWISGLNVIIFFSNSPFILTTLSVAFSMIWVRGTFPRMRYDELMYMCWKNFLPLSIIHLTLFIITKFVSMMNM